MVPWFLYIGVTKKTHWSDHHPWQNFPQNESKKISNLKNRTAAVCFSVLQCSFAKACHSFGGFLFVPCPMAQKMVNGNPLLNQMVLIWGLWFKAWPQNPRFMWLKNFHFHHGSGSPSNILAVSFHLGILNTSMTSWWFQPIWKILVKLDHFPR